MIPALLSRIRGFFNAPHRVATPASAKAPVPANAQATETLSAPAAAEVTHAQVSDYWNNWQLQQEATPDVWQDWADHPVILNCINATLFGAPDRTVFDYLKQQHPDFAHAHALSLCSGDGHFEKLLIRQGVFARITGIDLASARVHTASQSEPDLAGKLHFVVGDVNAGKFGTQRYDLVFAKAALHHIANLEDLFTGIIQCLRPGGHLVTIDFFGPDRFQWTALQVEYATRMLLELPAQLRTRADGSCKDSIDRPTVQQMIVADPSEAVRSADIHAHIAANFRISEEFSIGGTLLHLVFTPDILNNFRPDNPEHVALIERAWQQERELLASGTLPSDFRFIVATAQPQPVSE